MRNPHAFKQLVFDAIMFAYLLCVILATFIAPEEMQAQLQQLERNGMIFALGAVLGAIVSVLGNRAGLLTLGGLVFQSPSEHAQLEPRPTWRSIWSWQLLAFMAFTFVVGLSVTKFSVLEILDVDGFAGAMRLFGGLTNPAWEILPRAVGNIIETIFMAFMATALAIPLAFVLCFFCSKNIMVHPMAFIFYMILRTTLNISRSIEALIWAIIFSVWVGIGPFAGMLALMIHSIASLAKQYSEAVEAVSDGPIEGIKSTGANKLQTIWFAIVPQVILPFIAFTVYRWDINIRMATIIGLVGGGGIGTMLLLYTGQAMWNEVGTIILVIAFVVWFMDTASAYIREALK